MYFSLNKKIFYTVFVHLRICSHPFAKKHTPFSKKACALLRERVGAFGGKAGSVHVIKMKEPCGGQCPKREVSTCFCFFSW